MASNNPLNSPFADEEEGEFISPFARSDNLPQQQSTSSSSSSTLSYPSTDPQPTSSSPPPQHQENNSSSSSTTTTTTTVKKTKPQLSSSSENATNNNTTTTTTTTSSQDPPVIKKPEWVPDNSSFVCEIRCGHLFCSDCCSLNVSLPPEFGYTTRVKVCSKCFTVTINDRAREETTITINVGGVSKETKLVSGLHKVLLWKMGAYDDGDFDRNVIDSLENYPSNAIPVSRVQDLILDASDLDVQGCPGFRVRIYNPSLDPGEKPSTYPILMWFHTGGFVSKSVESPSVDGLCRLLSNQAHCVVVSVDYRLAPECMFPSAVKDCYAATLWAVKKAATFAGDPSRVVVAGDSVGGNLAAAVALMARDKEAPRLAGQILIYPILDLKRNEDKYYTRIVHADGYLMPMSYFKWFSAKYCRDSDIDNPYASPLRAASTDRSLADLPLTHMITAGHDPFCDEGELYVKKLRSAGVKVYHTRYTNSPHGFFAIGLDESNEAVMEVSIALKYMFRKISSSSSNSSR
eukprot:gene796-990_t